MNTRFFSLGMVLVCGALIGAGCTTRPVATVDQLDASSSTVVSDASPAATTTPTLESQPSRLVFLEGELPDLGTTSITLTLGTEDIRGSYESAQRRGAIFGRYAKSMDDYLDLTFYLGDEDLLSLAGQYDANTGELEGRTKRPSDGKESVVLLKAKVQKESARIQLKKIEQEKTLGRGISCHTSLEYPVILANEFIHADRADRINAHIRTFLGETATSTLSMQVDRGQADCIALQTQEPLPNVGGSDEPSGLNDYEFETSSAITRNERGVLSIVYTTYTYTGGAHPNTVIVSQTFDLTTGDQLELSNFVRQTGLSTWIQREQAALLATEYGEMLFEPEIAQRLADGSLKGAAASSTAAYQSLEQWYLTGNTFVRYYQSYEIAPYAAGIPSVSLPFSGWRDLAAPGSARWF